MGDPKDLFVEGVLQKLKEIHELEHNSIVPWAGIFFCSKVNVEYPQWICRYLGESAGRIFDLPAGDGKRLANKIVLALAMDTCGKGNELTRYFGLMKKVNAYETFYEILSEEKEISKGAAIRKTVEILVLKYGEKEVSEKSVTNWINEIDPKWSTSR